MTAEIARMLGDRRYTAVAVPLYHRRAPLPTAMVFPRHSSHVARPLAALLWLLARGWLLALGCVLAAAQPATAQTPQGPPPIVVGSRVVTTFVTGHLKDATSNDFFYASSDTVQALLHTTGLNFDELPSDSLPLPANTTARVATGDLDGDGHADYVFAYTTAGSITVCTVLNAGQGHFGAHACLSFTDGGAFSPILYQVQVVQVRSGGPALVLVGDGGNDIVTVLKSTGGVLTQAGELTPSQSTILEWNFVTGDFNGDGNVDVATSRADTLLPFYGSGDGTFRQGAPVPAPSPGYNDFYALAADLDGDGYTDILYSGSMDPVPRYVFQGGPNGLDSSPQPISISGLAAALPTAYLYTPIDLNGDGTPDLIAQVNFNSITALLASPGARQRQYTYTAGATYATGSVSQLVVADFNLDGSPDIAYTLNLSGDLGIHILPGTSAAATSGAAGVAAAPEPSLYGAAFTLTATLNTPATPAAAGRVDFSVDGTYVGTGTVSGNMASYTVTAPTYLPGPHTLTAVYSGDANYPAATFSGSHAVSFLRSATSFTNTTPTITYGQVPDGSGSVTEVDTAPGATLDGGTISFFIDGTNVCTLPINGRLGACPPSTGIGLHAGTHTIYAAYSGNQYYGPSQSATSTVTVLPASTQLGLTAQPNPSSFGQLVTVVGTAVAGGLTPVGTFSLFDGTTQIYTAPLMPVTSGSGASFSTSTLSPGTHVLTAHFDLTPDFLSGQLQVTQVVNPPVLPSYTITVTPAQPDLLIGVSNALGVTVTESVGFAQPLTLACGGLAPETTCTFAQPAIAPGGGTVTMLVRPSSPHPCDSALEYQAPGAARLERGSWMAFAGLGLCGLLGRRRRWLRQLALVGMLACLVPPTTVLTGCGNCTDLGVRPGTYTLQVNGYAPGGAAPTGTVLVRYTTHL